MKVTVITQNANLVQFLRANPSINVQNVYTDLAAEYSRFIDELNLVDVLLLIDYEDLSFTLSHITKAIKSGSAYLLTPKEVVLVTYTDLSLSHTPNAQDKFTAFKSVLAENGYNFRLVANDTIEFHSVYEAIIKDTVLEDDDLQVYGKYKVYRSQGGIAIKPKKNTQLLQPEKIGDTRADLVAQDKATRDVVGDTVIPINKETPLVRRSSSGKISTDTAKNHIVPLVIITGVKYSGKSTLMIRIMNELHKHGYGSLGVDTSSRKDIRQLLRFNGASFKVLNGPEIFEPSEDSVAAVQVFHPIITSNFLSSLTHLTANKACVLCEVDLDKVSSFINTYPGKTYLVVVTDYDFTKLRDTANILKMSEYHELHVVVNSREAFENSDMVEDNIKAHVPYVKEVSYITDMQSVISRLGVV